MKKLVFVPLVLIFISVVALAQPRPVDRAVIPTAAAKPAPVVFTAKYEGGLFGFTEKETGTLKFDDENERIVFIGKDQKERFGIPYKSLIVISPQSRSVTSNTGNVIRNIPLPGASIAGAFIKEKRRYMLLQFNDPDADARGVTTFKVEDKALLDSVIETLGKKAKMTQRGDAYYRPRPVKTEI